MTSSLVVLILCAVIFAGCGGGAPSETNGRAYLSYAVLDESKRGIHLVSFKKTNSTRTEQSFALEYEAVIEFDRDGSWSSGGIGSQVSFAFSDGRASSVAIMQPFNSSMGIKNVRQGQRETVRGSILFQKTEKGWRAPDGNFY